MSSDCPPGYFDNAPNPDDCNSFYKCEDGEAYLMPCPNGLHFNAITKVCDYPGDAGCEVGSGERRYKAAICDCPGGDSAQDGLRLICTSRGNLDPCTSSTSCMGQKTLGGYVVGAYICAK